MAEQSWTSGYITDLNYTFGYYAELNPIRLKFAFLLQGLDFPDIVTACELGFGQGVSLNIHAAASAVEWYGNDFNPSHVGFARSLAVTYESSAKLFDDNFSEFTQRLDLPEFDFIALHGVWSWISDENQTTIVDFIKRKLKVGGVVYISYNTLPGWADFLPMRYLMTKCAEVMGSEAQGIVGRIDAAIDFTQKMIDSNPIYSRVNPASLKTFDDIKKRERSYLAHEYFNRDWSPMYFASISELLKEAKVEYACSAAYKDYIDSAGLTSDQQAFLSGIPDLSLRETARDFIMNKKFRKDYWVKGPRRLNHFDRIEKLRKQRLILVTYRPDIELKINTPSGEALMNESIYDPILDLLADHKVRSIAQIEDKLKSGGVSLENLLEALTVLIAMGHLVLAQDEAVVDRVKKQTSLLNANLCRQARESNNINFLASPLTGGGVIVNRFEQISLTLIAQGKKQPSEWVAEIWQLLESQGQRLLKNGKVLATPEENKLELTDQLNCFAEKRLQMLKALEIL